MEPLEFPADFNEIVDAELGDGEPCFLAKDFPPVPDWMRKPPKLRKFGKQGGQQATLFDADDDE